MTSEEDAGLPAAKEAFVWIWLPGEVQPVIAGRIERDGNAHIFTYGRSYLERDGAIPIYSPELDLKRGAIAPDLPLDMASCLRDGAPDAWGRRVIINRLTGLQGTVANDVDFDELTFMLNSGSCWTVGDAGSLLGSAPLHSLPPILPPDICQKNTSRI